MPRAVNARAYPHGTTQRARYCFDEDGRTCTDCRAANARRKQEMILARARGEFAYYPVDDVVAHLNYLGSMRMGVHSIAREAGCSSSSLDALRRGLKTRVGRDLRARILAVKLKPMHLNPKAHNLRLQALYALGYSRDWQGVRFRQVTPPRYCYAYVERRTAERIVNLLKEIGDTPGPSEITRTRAKNLGYRVPADFDGDLFYDVDWDGEEEELEPAMRSDAVLEDAAEIERHLREPSNDHERQLNRELVEARLGVTYHYIVRLRSERTSRDWKRKQRAA